MTDLLLEVTDLHAAYGDFRVLHGLSFSVDAGGISALLGANGAGKSTTLRALSGMIRRSGSVRLNGAEIVGKATEDLVRLGIAHVPEGRGTFTGLTTEENLLCGAMSRQDRAGIARDLDRAYDWFPRLRERRSQQAGTLSGGEQQMLAIARALMLRPKLMLLDEPSFGLAPLVTAELFGILRKVNAEEGVGMLIVEQNASLALDLAERAYLLETGTIVIAETAAAIRDNDSVRAAYLGY
jgi:branched-chain amino acid transport system ATP-binding protein